MPKPKRIWKVKESGIEVAICGYLSLLRQQLRGKLFFWKCPTAGFFDTKRRAFRKQSNPWAINGVSDLIVIIDGKVMFVELKSLTGRQSDSQIAFQLSVEAAGCEYHIVRSVAEMQTIMSRTDRTATNIPIPTL